MGQPEIPAGAPSSSTPVLQHSSTPISPFLPVLELRSRVLQSIRRWFTEHDFIEVETPVRLAAPSLELLINAEPAGECFLRTSRELHMKRIMAAGAKRIFQMGPCFRRGERG